MIITKQFKKTYSVTVYEDNEGSTYIHKAGDPSLEHHIFQIGADEMNRLFDLQNQWTLLNQHYQNL